MKGINYLANNFCNNIREIEFANNYVSYNKTVGGEKQFSRIGNITMEQSYGFSCFIEYKRYWNLI